MYHVDRCPAGESHHVKYWEIGLYYVCECKTCGERWWVRTEEND